MSEISTKIFEGLRLHVYMDTTGNRTIGYGHNLETKRSEEIFKKLGLNHYRIATGRLSISPEQAEAIFQIDYHDHRKEVLKLVPNFDTHPKLVQDILVDLCFNLGPTGLSKFKNTLKSFIAKDYKDAARGLQNSLWFKQVKSRGVAIVNALESL